MSVTYIDAVSDGSNNSSSFEITHGLTFNEDDAGIAKIHMNGTGRTVDTPPSGWIIDEEGDSDLSGGSSYAVLKKDMTDSEPSSYTFGISSNGRISVIINQLRGSTVLVPDVFPAATDGAETGSNSTEGPDITVADNSMAFVWHLEDTNSGAPITSVDNSYTWPDAGLTNFQAQDFAYRAFDTGAATGETKMTSEIEEHQGFSFSYKESGGAPPEAALTGEGSLTAIGSVIQKHSLAMSGVAI